MRDEEYFACILAALGVGEDKGVPSPAWRHEEYLKAIYDTIKASHAIKYDEQTLTIAQKKQALLNLDGARIVKLTDGTLMLQDLVELIAEINMDGEHVFFDTAAIGYPMYMCTIAINYSGSIPTDYRLNDLVTGSISIGAYSASKTLAEILAEAASPIFPMSIAVTTQPTTTHYEVGESLDSTGMVVTMTMSDGTTITVANSDLSFSPVVFSTAGSQTVTITCQDGHYTLATTLTVTVEQIILNTWAKRRQIAAAGLAKYYWQVGDMIADSYTVGGTSYTCNWIVMDFRDVEDENGTVYHDIPILQMQRTNHEDVVFDAKEETEATEETAQSGYYYCGFDGTNYTMLTLAVGDTIPYNSYTKVYKTLWNAANAIRYGLNNWKFSFIRQYLNHSGTGWATPQHACDVLPSGAEAKTGFMSYISAEMAAVLHPIKVTTKQPGYMGGGTDITYDIFWLAAVSEVNMKNINASPDEGDPWAYYKELLESSVKVDTGTYDVMKRYEVINTTSAKDWWSRSSYLGIAYMWHAYASGNMHYNLPGASSRVLPACALI